MIRILFSIVFACVFSSGYSQDSTSVQNQKLSYYKIDAGIIIDCPVLTMRIHDKLMAVKGIKEYDKNRPLQSIFFALPEGTYTKEQVVNLAVGCGFPEQSIKVFMDSNPFKK